MNSFVNDGVIPRKSLKISGSDRLLLQDLAVVAIESFAYHGAIQRKLKINKINI